VAQTGGCGSKQGGAGADAGARMEQSRGQDDTACTGSSAGARTQGAGEGAADAGARVKQHVHGGAEWELERHELGSAGARVLESRCKRWSGRNVGGTEQVA
jgi:hypothetical protein